MVWDGKGWYGMVCDGMGWYGLVLPDRIVWAVLRKCD